MTAAARAAVLLLAFATTAHSAMAAEDDAPQQTMPGNAAASARPGVPPQTSSTPRQSTELPAGITAQPSLIGRVLADHRGRTLYSTTSPPTSLNSASPWQPLEIPWLATPQAPFGKVALPDGRQQWTYHGRPLYRHARDRDPQDIRGHGLEGGWQAIVIQPPPALPPWATVQRVDVGWVFADRQGFTVYAPARPEAQAAAQTCPPDCKRRYWRPLLASPEDRTVGRWTIIVNPEGQRQWAYSDRPLYTHTRDRKPGEMMGQSFAVGYLIGDGFRVIPVETQIAALGS